MPVVILRRAGLAFLLIFPNGKTAGFWAFSARSGVFPPAGRDFVFLVNYLADSADRSIQATNSSYHQRITTNHKGTRNGNDTHAQLHNRSATRFFSLRSLGTNRDQRHISNAQSRSHGVGGGPKGSGKLPKQVPSSAMRHCAKRRDAI